MAMIQKKVTLVGGVPQEVLTGTRLQNVPPGGNGAGIAIAAVTAVAGTTLTAYSGQRTLVESALLNKAAADIAPRIPEDVLVADEIGLPNEVISVSIVNAANSDVIVRVDVTEL